MTDQLEVIKARKAASTPGPWGWRGQIGGSIELRCLHSMGRRIVTSQRSEPCTVELPSDSIWGDWALAADACAGCTSEAVKPNDPFVDYRCAKPENLDTIWMCAPDGSFIRPVNEWAVREVHYRNDVVRVDHPDAEFIAHAPEDVDWLIVEVDRLRAELDAVGRVRA